MASPQVKSRHLLTSVINSSICLQVVPQGGAMIMRSPTARGMRPPPVKPFASLRANGLDGDACACFRNCCGVGEWVNAMAAVERLKLFSADLHHLNINRESPQPFALSKTKGLITRCNNDLETPHAVRSERREGFDCHRSNPSLRSGRTGIYAFGFPVFGCLGFQFPVSGFRFPEPYLPQRARDQSRLQSRLPLRHPGPTGIAERGKNLL